MEPLKLKKVCFRPAVDDKGFDIFCGEDEPIGYLCHIYPDGELELLKWLTQKVTNGGNDMPKVDDRPMFRVGKWSIRESSAKEIEDWMNIERQDYHMDQTIQEGDTLIIILYLSHRFRRRRAALTPVKTTKKTAAKKEPAKK